MGAYVNGVHCLQMLPPDDSSARARLKRLAQMGVTAGVWQVWLQRPPHLVPRLRSSPWWRKEDFPWTELLERNFPAIREEVLALLSYNSRSEPSRNGSSGQPNDVFTPVGGRAAHDHTLVVAGEWKEFPLFGNGESTARSTTPLWWAPCLSYPTISICFALDCILHPRSPPPPRALSPPLPVAGRKYEQSCARCPVTAKTMEYVPAAMELAMAGGGETLFSTLKPGTHLRPHCGSTNARLTCHMGIIVPAGCTIRCGEEWRGWKEGECIVFDDSWEHEVFHRGESDRIVLLINFWHPDLPADQRRIQLNTHGYEPI